MNNEKNYNYLLSDLTKLRGVGNKIAVPNLDTIWKVKGNRVLSNNSDVTLEWDNGRGLTFTKTISLDEKYLFKIKQKVKNNTSSEVSLYPYAQITRNKKPDDVMGFYILHGQFQFFVFVLVII